MDNTELPVNIEGHHIKKARYFWFELMGRLIFEDSIAYEIKKIINEKTNREIEKHYKKKYIPRKQFKNISKEIDGNPVYLCRIDEIKKSIRIIQEPPTEEILEIGAWVTPAKGKKTFDELVISLELNKESYLIAKALICYWLFQNEDNEDMNEFIDQLIDHYE